MSHNVYRDGKVHVCKEQCSTCVFRPGNLMHLEPGRVKGMVDATEEGGDGATIICHQTLEQEQNAICRGWMESKAGQNDLVIRLAHAHDIVEEIDPLAQGRGATTHTRRTR